MKHVVQKCTEGGIHSDLGWFKIILAVIRWRTITSAAKQLNRLTVSRRIKL